MSDLQSLDSAIDSEDRGELFLTISQNSSDFKEWLCGKVDEENEKGQLFQGGTEKQSRETPSKLSTKRTAIEVLGILQWCEISYTHIPSGYVNVLSKWWKTCVQSKEFAFIIDCGSGWSMGQGNAKYRSLSLPIRTAAENKKMRNERKKANRKTSKKARQEYLKAQHEESWE